LLVVQDIVSSWLISNRFPCNKSSAMKFIHFDNVEIVNGITDDLLGVLINMSMS